MVALAALRDVLRTLNREHAELRARRVDVLQQLKDKNALLAAKRDLASQDRNLRRRAPGMVRHILAILQCAEELRSEWLRLQPDCVVSHDIIPGLAAIEAKRVLGSKIYLDAIEIPDFKLRSDRALTDSYDHLDIFYRVFMSHILEQTDLAISVSEGICEWIEQHGVPATFVPNYRHFSPVPRTNFLRQQLRVDDSKFVVLQLNSVYRTFKFETVLEAWKAAPKNYVLVTLGNIVPESYKAELDAYIEREELKGRVFFLPAVGYNDLSQAAAGANVMLMSRNPEVPNNYLSMPNRIFDALAAGLPIVSSYLKDIDAFLVYHGVGKSFEFGNAGDMFAALEAVNQDLPRFKAKVEAANQKCTWESLEDQLGMIFAPFETVAFVGTRDIANNNRTLRLAASIQRMGKRTAIVGPNMPEDPIPGVEYVQHRLFRTNPLVG